MRKQGAATLPHSYRTGDFRMRRHVRPLSSGLLPKKKRPIYWPSHTAHAAPAAAVAPAGHRPRLLVIYATRHGQTAQIAVRIAGQLKGAGYDVMLSDVDDLGWHERLDAFAGVLIGGSALRGRHPSALRRFVARHREALNALPTGFFSVGGYASVSDPAARKAAYDRMQRFLAATGWRASTAAAFRGAIAYTRYSPLLRVAMRRAVARYGGPTDTTRDHELTDWEEVQHFTQTFAASLARPPARPVHQPRRQPSWLLQLAGAGA